MAASSRRSAHSLTPLGNQQSRMRSFLIRAKRLFMSISLAPITAAAVSMFLALPVHASDSKGNEVDAAWAKFVASPSGANAEAAARLLDDGQRLTSSVEDLSILDSEVQAGKSEAIHLAFAINAAYGAHFAEEA